MAHKTIALTTELREPNKELVFKWKTGWKRGKRAEPKVALTMRNSKSPATRNRTRDHLIAAVIYSQMLYQLSYSRRCPFRKQ